MLKPIKVVNASRVPSAARHTRCSTVEYAAGIAKNWPEIQVFERSHCGKFRASAEFSTDSLFARSVMKTVDYSTVEDWLHLIQAEYLEMPGLQLTKPQVRRMWGLEAGVCDEVLDALVSSEFLEHTPNDRYILGSALRH
jgi:hypothetical protein